jgi:hypothetical protein
MTDATFRYIVYLTFFTVGLLFYTRAGETSTYDDPPTCPNLLIQQGQVFYLYNSRAAKIPRINPIRFDSLDEYSVFLKWQRSHGVQCPVLYIQRAFDASGEEVYQSRPSVFEPQHGIP